MPATTDETKPTVSELGRKYLRLQLAGDVGPLRLRKLLECFGSIDAVLCASPSQLTRVDGIGRQIAESIVKARTDDRADLEIEQAAKRELRILSVEDDDYPRSLLHIHDPPICLYVKGGIEPADGVALAIVGSRNCSHYGREQAVRFAELLARAGFTVVSGLARGIDGHAHRGAINAGGRTIAVLGNGLSSIYPPEHESLAGEIVGAGALLSETPLDSAPDGKNFPRRNRIIVGLSLGVIVIEAGNRSGALISARLAHEYNRELFAVPGRVDRPEFSAGVNALIRDGLAKLVTCLDDVLDELGDVGRIMGPGVAKENTGVDHTEPPSAGAAERLTPDEGAVLKAIREGKEETEEISAAAGLDAGRVASVLTSLQLKGLVKRLPGNRFTMRRP